MQLTPEQRKAAEIFTPYALKRLDDLEQKDLHFVHYTSAEVVSKIIRNRSIWMRNAQTMNDYSEMAHGRACLVSAWRGPIGDRLREILNRCAAGLADDIAAEFDGKVHHLMENTYLLCLSEHNPLPPDQRLFDEDIVGRLSMWRAYGGDHGVAIVIDRRPLAIEPGALKLYLSPVAYLDDVAFKAEFDAWVSGLEVNAEYLQMIGRERLKGAIFEVFKYAVLSTKHPGFAEEREWRIIHNPTLTPSVVLEESFEIVRDVPQKVYKIPLRNQPEYGIENADVAGLIHRLIIGPTSHELTIYQTLSALLSDAGVANPAPRIWSSRIPLRRF